MSLKVVRSRRIRRRKERSGHVPSVPKPSQPVRYIQRRAATGGHRGSGTLHASSSTPQPQTAWRGRTQSHGGSPVLGSESPDDVGVLIAMKL